MQTENKDRFLENAVPAADVLSKIIGGIIIVVVGLYFTSAKDFFGKKYQCYELEEKLLNSRITKDAFSYKVSKISKICGYSEEEASNLAAQAGPFAIIATSESDLPKSPGGAQLPNGSAPPQGVVDGQVAVGYVSSALYTDVNFNSVKGSLSSLQEGDIIRARWDVNIRPIGKLWDQPVRIMRAGQCFRVQNTTVRDADGAPQTWASGNIVSCPKAGTL
ncbi:MAG: hypothetical protein ABII76_21730 [Pseudomonadota bacterium]|jgi:hypothetical protein